MRTLLAILASVTLLSAKAQSHLAIPTWGFGYTPWQTFNNYNGPVNLTNNKWQLRPSAGLSAGYIFANGGISYIAAPLALTLYHPLTSNITAFGGLIATPVAFSVSRLYSMPNQAGAPFNNGYGLGINAGIQGGLMYTNDAHTFSISGSVSVERGGYPVYPTTRHPSDPK